MIIGLVGKPSSGKSSFFKASTMIDVKISPVPFTTIQPNIGIAYIAIDCVEKELNVKCNPKHGYCKNGKRFIPVKLADVGGLIPGSHLGKGIGNKFLDEIRQASALIQVIDASGLTDSEGNPATNYDPNTEIEFLENEIDLWFADVIKRALQKITKVSSKAELIQILSEQLSGLELTKSSIEKALEQTSYTDAENFARAIRKISKPIILAANKIDLKHAQENFERLKQKYKSIVPTSAEAEIALKKASEKGLIEYSAGNGFEIKGSLEENQKKALDFIKTEVIEKYGSTGVQNCLNKAVFELLNYIAVYPVADTNKLADKDGNVLPDVHLVPQNTTAKELAFKIHTTIGEKFIAGIDARTKRRLSADYQLKNNDVVEIIFSK
ncbi:MAG: redox-regulated ATPase YchF [Candidatus Aenigmarchaeota archaeon]|nr:redox-regulated ATPase YchF [Candidatus Aenigmarchaeota archaeon]